MVGLTLGVAVLITVLSVMNGFDRELKGRILGVVPQATVTASEIIPNWQTLAQTIQKPQSWSRRTFYPITGMLTANGQIRRYHGDRYWAKLWEKVSIIHQHMESGSVDSLKAGQFDIVIGKQIGGFAGMKQGDMVTWSIARARHRLPAWFPRF